MATITETFYLELLEEGNNRPEIRRGVLSKRIIRDQSNPIEYCNEEEFRKRYRLRKGLVLNLLDVLKGDLEFASCRNQPILPIFRLLLTLRYYATGEFQKSDGDLIEISQSSASRIVKQVSEAIATRKNRFIYFPRGNERRLVQDEFFSRSSIPRVVGAIDGTHIPIKSPGGENAEVFRCRKGYFSLNVQMVSLPNYIISNIVCRWPGSTHDSRIYENSRLKDTMEAGCDILLGDSGYACTANVMTPIIYPTCPAERAYNRSHIKERGCVERSFGILKQRFWCLKFPLRTQLSTSMSVIIAVVCLHNYAIRGSDTFEAVDEGSFINVDEDQPVLEQESSLRGSAVRTNIIETYFNN